MATRSQGMPELRDTAGLARTVVAAMAAVAACDVLWTLLAVLVTDGHPVGGLFLGAWLLRLLVGTPACVLFFVWFHRSWTNLRALGAGDQPVGAAGSVLWWFVPLANVAMAPFLLWRLWRASTPLELPEQSWRDRASTELERLAVVGCFALGVVQAYASSRMMGQLFSSLDQPGPPRSDLVAAALALVTSIASCWLSCLYVLAVARRQRERHEQLPRGPSLRKRAGDMGAARCPYCHADVAAGESREWCEGCRACSHVGCWGEQGGCAACGGVVSLAAQELADAQRRRTIGLVIVGVVLALSLGVRALIG